MATTPRKSGTPKSSISENQTTTVNGSSSPSRSHTRSPSASTNGLTRTPSGRSTPVSARAAARKPGRSNLSMSSVPKANNNDPSEEEARAQNAALIEDLKEQLQKAETASEQYRKQLGVFQMRLDEAVSEQGKLEDHSHERDSKIEVLNGEIREHVRQIRDLEQSHEMERNAMLQEKEQQGIPFHHGSFLFKSKGTVLQDSFVCLITLPLPLFSLLEPSTTPSVATVAILLPPIQQYY